LEVPGLELKDDVTWIFLNTRGTNDEEVSPALVQLLHYFEHTNDADCQLSDERLLALQKNIKSVQENAEVGVKYMQLWEEKAIERQEGREQGREEGLKEGHEEGLKEGHESGIREGHQCGLTDGVFSLLEGLGDIPDELKTRIQSEKDTEKIKGWLKTAAKAKSIDDFEKMIG
jgi:flagellar biosynthesis/type III secretory pathway protein FliH